ncbi:MAG: tyrosine-type recombinase/integrase [Anaerolineae bacterium]|nr:tyrosine-type recombinase/integrase [Anaerolineae bacterium]
MNAIIPANQNSITQTDQDQALSRFDELAARFLATRKSEATRRTYSRALFDYRATAESLGLDPLGGDALIAFNSAMQQQRRDNGGTLANDTLRTRLKAVQSLFTWGYTFGAVAIKPEMVSELITMPEARKLSPRDILTGSEATALLKRAPNDQAYTIMRVMLDCGLRLAEALNLKREDVYSAGGLHFISVKAGKGDKSRDVQISGEVYKVILGYAERQGISEGKLFNAPRRTVQYWVSSAAQRAGLDKKITPHSLRHSLGNAYALAGVDIAQIGEILGHASLDTTRLYTRPASVLKQAQLPALPWG